MLNETARIAQRDKIERIVADACARGAQVLVGGRRPPSPQLEKGALFEPTILAGLDNQAAAVREEIFGPVLCALPFDDEEDLIAQANDSDYGLAAGIWTADFTRAWCIARRLEAGTVWDQHLQAALDRHTFRRLQAERARTRKGAFWSAPFIHSCRKLRARHCVRSRCGFRWEVSNLFAE